MEHNNQYTYYIAISTRVPLVIIIFVRWLLSDHSNIDYDVPTAAQSTFMRVPREWWIISVRRVRCVQIAAFERSHSRQQESLIIIIIILTQIHIELGQF